MKFECYYDPQRFAYMKNFLDKSSFVRVGSRLPNMRKVAVFICDKFNVYIDCIDREYPLSAKGAVEHANGKPFLYLKTAYSPTGSKEIITIIENGGGKIEPFFKWCGANLGDQFYKKLYPVRKEFILKGKSIDKKYDIGFCCSLDNHPVKKVSDSRKRFLSQFRGYLGDTVYHSDKLKYMPYVNESLKWKFSFNCPGVGEYTSRMMDACSIGTPPLLNLTDYDNAISWKGYFPEVDFSKEGWEKELEEVIVNYKEWGEKSLYYYENHWTPKAIFSHFTERINIFEDNLK